jgi:predicted nucleic acid-binding protein
MSLPPADIVLIDATLIRNFIKRGFHRRLSDFFGDCGALVLEVLIELERYGETDQRMLDLLEEWPTEIVELPPELALQVRDIVEFLREEGQHERQNEGEVATVILAEHLQNKGNSVLVITDDSDGKALARQRKVDYVDTPAVIIEMVLAGVLSEEEGAIVWRETFTNRERWRDFESRLAAARSTQA